MKLVGTLHTLLLLLLLNPFAIHSQRVSDRTGKPLSSKELVSEGTFVIPSGKTRILTAETPKMEHLIIRGTLLIKDTEDVNLYAHRIHVEGGTLIAGSATRPFQHQLAIYLGGQKEEESFLKVSGGGQLLLYGAYEDLASSLKDTPWLLKEDQLKQSIKISAESETHDATVLIDSAMAIEISGAYFQSLGNNKTPALSWFGKTDGPARIDHSVFSGSQNVDLYLDKTAAIIENNVFLSKNNSTIVCSPSGIGVRNQIIKNTIYNTNDKGAFALTVNNPYQTLSKNTIHLEGNSKGIAILAPKGYESFTWREDPKMFHLSENHIEMRSTKHPVESVGIEIGHLKHNGIWRSNQNTIINMALGLRTASKNLVIDNFSLKNNTVGIMPGESYIQNCELANDQKYNTSIGIWITDEKSASEPKISGVQLTNYQVGFQIDGHIGEFNYFEKIQYDRTTTPLQFGKLSKETVLYDKDRSLSQIPLPTATSEPVIEIHGHQHGGKGKHKGLYIFNSTSSLATKDSAPYPSDTRIFTAPVSNFGTLTIATGFGLEDPVHEHHQQFNEILLKHTETNRIWNKENALDTEPFFLAANGIYEFEYGQRNAPLYDLSFEWDAPDDTWIILKFRYTHPNIRGLRSFGSLIEPALSMHDLMHQNKTSYYYDIGAETVYAKIYNQRNRDEIVIYSSDILTEIKVDGQKVPLSIYTDTENEKVVIAYDLPTALPSKLVLADNYGNTLKTLHQGTSEAGKISNEFNLSEYDVREGVYLYFLTVDGQTHKGPVYAY